MLTHMTDKQKRAIRDMREFGLTYAEIAKNINLSPNTVKSFCRRSGISSLDPSGSACKLCGKPLQHCPGRKKKLFCNNQCRSDWWNRKRRWSGREGYAHSRYGDGVP